MHHVPVPAIVIFFHKTNQNFSQTFNQIRQRTKVIIQTLNPFSSQNGIGGPRNGCTAKAKKHIHGWLARWADRPGTQSAPD